MRLVILKRGHYHLAEWGHYHFALTDSASWAYVFFAFFKVRLFSTKQAIARISQTRYDKPGVVEPIIDCGQMDRYFRVRLTQSCTVDLSSEAGFIAPRKKENPRPVSGGAGAKT